MNYLVSYNRSGNTWIRYILEYLSGRPTWGHEKFSISERFKENSPIILTSSDPIIIKRHELIPREITTDDKVIFILRDYKECIWNSMNCKHEKFEEEYRKYQKLLYFFEKFRGEKRLLRYDSIINEPEISIILILYFLDLIGKTKESVEEFCKNIEQHKENCFSIYSNSINTREQKTTFSKEDIDFMTSIVERISWSEYIFTKDL